MDPIQRRVSKMTTRVKKDEDGPYYDVNVQGSGNPVLTQGQPRPEAIDPPPAQRDPVLAGAAQRASGVNMTDRERAALEPSRWSVRGGYGGEPPELPENYDFKGLEDEYQKQESSYDQRFGDSGVQKQEGEFLGPEDFSRANVPYFTDDDVDTLWKELDSSGIDPGLVNPRFLESEYGLSREQAMEMWSSLQDWTMRMESPTQEEAAQWMSPDEVAQLRGYMKP